MLTVRLHGHLEEKFGSEFRFEAATVREVIDALQANFDNFTEEFIKDQRVYNILVDADAQDMLGCVIPIKTDSVVDIIPVIGGAGFLKSIGLIIAAYLLIVYAPYLAGALLPGVTGTALTTFAAAGLATTTQLAVIGAVQAIGWGLALAGVASLLAGPDGPDGGGEKSSSLSQTENIVGQGMPIPIGYGRLMVGSIVLSSTFISSYTQTTNAWTYENTDTGLNDDKIIDGTTALSIDTPNASSDGFSGTYTIPTMYTPEQLIQIRAAAETALGGGTYEMVNHTTAAGTTIRAPVYKPKRIAGSYDDSSINHK